MIDYYTNLINRDKRAIQFNPNDSDNFERLGNLYAKDMKLPHLAIRYYKKALFLNKQNGSYYLNLSLVDEAIGKVSDSIRNMEFAIRFDPHNDVLYNELGLLYKDQSSKKDLKRSLLYFNRAIKFSVGNANYYYNKGIAELSLGRLENSARDMLKGSGFASNNKLNNKCSIIFNNLGIKYAKERKYNYASYCYTISLAFKNDEATVYGNLADSERYFSKEKAMENAKEGLRIDPHNYLCKGIINQLKASKHKVHQLTYNPHVNYTKKLNSLIGLSGIKQQINRYINRAVINKMRTGKSGHGEIHLVLEGNPGTGKTTVAKLLCGILYQKHIINKKAFVLVNSPQLLSSKYGKSAKYVRDAIKEAKGGCLFIDEAYHLAHRNDGNSEAQDEALAELLPDIEAHRNDLVVIMAGYTHAMEHFLTHCNPGLGSRFPTRFQFPNYTNEECNQILDLNLRQNHVKLSSTSAKQLLSRELMSFINADRSDPRHKFSNARAVRTIYRHLFDTFSSRLMNTYTKSQLKNFKRRGYKLNTFTKADVKNTFKRYNVSRNGQNAMQKLNNLIGLKHVKSLIKIYINQMKVRKIRMGIGTHDEMNMVFEGNPGTGKTTVAKLFCQILYETGITKAPNYVYVSAPHLQSKYAGGSAKNMRKVFRKAMNGVLFIDEAYSLDNHDNKSMVAQLISDISKYKNKVVFILAGYQDKMERFLNGANEGLSSRFPDRIAFPNYSNKECWQILQYDLKKRKLIMDSNEVKQALVNSLDKYISMMRNQSQHHFANARCVNNFFHCLCLNFDTRIGQYSVNQLNIWKKTKDKRLNVITNGDINNTSKKMLQVTKLPNYTSAYHGTSLGFRSLNSDSL